MGRPTKSRYVKFLLHVYPMTNGPPIEDEPGCLSDEDMSIEVISPPRRPITRSVSAKRAADEMESEDTIMIPSPPRPRKVRRVSGAFTDHCHERLLTLQQNFRVRFHCSHTHKALSRSKGVAALTP